MRAKLTLISLFLISLLAFGACKRVEAPDPAMTRAGAGGMGVGDVIPTELGQGAGFDEFGDGLSFRGDGSDDPFSGEQVRGLLEPVYFGFDQYNVTSTEASKLRAAATYMMDNPTARLIIEGHCDWRGTSEYNLALGERRASSVRQYLETLGVPGTRMRTNSFGDEQATRGGTEAQMRLDRRAELVIVR